MAEQRKGAVNWKGNPTDLDGPMLKVGGAAPTNFTVIANDMSAVTGASMAGTTRIICTVPSLDTAVCDTEMRRFNKEAADLKGVKVYAISADLPMAQKRWCGATESANLVSLSDYKDRTFGPAWGVWAPSKGLHARAVFVVSKKDKLLHVEYVADVVNEPDYKKALDAARGDA